MVSFLICVPCRKRNFSLKKAATTKQQNNLWTYVVITLYCNLIYSLTNFRMHLIFISQLSRYFSAFSFSHFLVCSFWMLFGFGFCHFFCARPPLLLFGAGVFFLLFFFVLCVFCMCSISCELLHLFHFSEINSLAVAYSYTHRISHTEPYILYTHIYVAVCRPHRKHIIRAISCWANSRHSLS